MVSPAEFRPLRSGAQPHRRGPLNDLGIVYAYLGDEERALADHHGSLRIREEIGSRQSQSTTPIHLGNLYLRQGEIEPALDNLHRALAIAEAIKVWEKIFEPFFTTKPTGNGTGLGLSLGDDIVTKGHGGTLVVESKPGEDATFVITLPVKTL